LTKVRVGRNLSELERCSTKNSGEFFIAGILVEEPTALDKLVISSQPETFEVN
jgi:hypothetical protein